PSGVPSRPRLETDRREVQVRVDDHATRACRDERERVVDAVRDCRSLLARKLHVEPAERAITSFARQPRRAIESPGPRRRVEIRVVLVPRLADRAAVEEWDERSAGIGLAEEPPDPAHVERFLRVSQLLEVETGRGADDLDVETDALQVLFDDLGLRLD